MLSMSPTLSQRLETISGLKVANLGVAGYGPFQYLEVLKRYALPLKPKYALFVFYAGNDIEDMRSYRKWETEGGYHTAYLLSRSFLVRYLRGKYRIRAFLRSVRICHEGDAITAAGSLLHTSKHRSILTSQW